MSLRPGLLPTLARAARPTLQKRGFHFLPNSGPRVAANPFKRVHDTHVLARARPAPKQGKGNSTLMYSIGLGLAGFALTTKVARCDSIQPVPAQPMPAQPRRPVVADDEVHSMVSIPTLTFGAVTGICAGVFVKKGFKLVAFVLGGVFVLLQVGLRGDRELTPVPQLQVVCLGRLEEGVQVVRRGLCVDERTGRSRVPHPAGLA